MMCVQTATNENDALNCGDSALNIEASNQSEKKLKLLCNPRNLPQPPYKPTKRPELTTEQTRIVEDYFGRRYCKLVEVARDKGWIRG